MKKLARVRKIPKVCAVTPVRIFGRRGEGDGGGIKRKSCGTANWEY